jgi:hypothetical protein
MIERFAPIDRWRTSRCIDHAPGFSPGDRAAPITFQTLALPAEHAFDAIAPFRGGFIGVGPGHVGLYRVSSDGARLLPDGAPLVGCGLRWQHRARWLSGAGTMMLASAAASDDPQKVPHVWVGPKEGRLQVLARGLVPSSSNRWMLGADTALVQSASTLQVIRRRGAALEEAGRFESKGNTLVVHGQLDRTTTIASVDATLLVLRLEADGTLTPTEVELDLPRRRAGPISAVASGPSEGLVVTTRRRNEVTAQLRQLRREGSSFVPVGEPRGLTDLSTVSALERLLVTRGGVIVRVRVGNGPGFVEAFTSARGDLSPLGRVTVDMIGDVTPLLLGDDTLLLLGDATGQVEVVRLAPDGLSLTSAGNTVEGVGGVAWTHVRPLGPLGVGAVQRDGGDGKSRLVLLRR